jgi:hypothetical protein
MEVIFGVQATDRTLKAELSDEQVATLRKNLEDAFGENPKGRILWVTDKEGVELAIPVDKLAFVEFGGEKSSRQVGFSSATAN